MSKADVELVQFAHSHFNEKVRWTLDLKGVPHTRRTVLPGPHIPVVKRLTGKTTTPVVRIDGEVVHDSTRIIEQLERHWPQPRLLPEDTAQRAKVLAVVAELDAELGPASRRIFWGLAREDHAYLAATFACEHGALVRRSYRLALRMIVGKVAQQYDLGQEALAESRGVVQRWFERIAESTRATGYLVGREFTLADLTAAALAIPVLPAMPNAPTRPAQVMPEPLARYVEAWDEHPSQAWFTRIYEQHRPADGSARVG